jgi:guanylate kinase
MSNEPIARRSHGQGLDESLLLVLSAPSGTGKTTLGRRLVEDTPNSVFSISCTTRRLRGAERDGVDYQFVSEHAFREMVQVDAFAEWAEVHGHFYGTSRTVVEDALAHGRLALFDIDVQGGEQLKARYPMAVTVMVLPPSYAELERRLRARGTDPDHVIERRLLAAQSEIRRGRSYDYMIVNDDVERALADLKAIVSAERLRGRRFDLAALGY